MFCTDFEQSLQQPAQPKADQKVKPTADRKVPPGARQKEVPDPEQKVASNVEVNTTPDLEEESGQTTEKESSLPKCIGPGCENNAQPDSVYCGNDCILGHAAAAMKSFTNVKDPKQDQGKAQKTNSTPKVIRTTSNGPLAVLWSKTDHVLYLMRVCAE